MDQALHATYWQPSPRGRLGTLICDCDGVDPIEAVWRGAAPPPTALVHNDASGHCHALYVLAEPVGHGGGSSPAAIRYAEAVWNGLEMALGADAAYTGLLSRGPYAPGHTLEVISGRVYELSALAAAVEMPTRVRRTTALTHVDSRNKAVFDQVRAAAYGVAACLDDAALLAHIVAAAQEANTALRDHPSGELGAREVLGIARSVYRWCVPRRSRLTAKLPGAVDRSRQHSRDRVEAAPVEIQRERQAAAGQMTADRRREATRGTIRAALAALERQGQPITAPALVAATGLSRAVLYKHSDLWRTAP